MIYFKNKNELLEKVEKLFLNCKLSKFTIVQQLFSSDIMVVRGPILKLIYAFLNTKTIYCDNESVSSSESITSLLTNQYGLYGVSEG